jgi:hypothetical protein
MRESERERAVKYSEVERKRGRTSERTEGN